MRLSAEELEAALANFRGEFAQRPPAVSAKKVDGRRSYELARKNIAVELERSKFDKYGNVKEWVIEFPQVGLRVL